jgi:TrmH family RNA methyltransferase
MNDPGNLGTLLRSALAAGVDSVYLMQGTVDPFNPKVVRGGMGAQLHLPIECVGANQLPDRLQGLAVWIAEPKRGIPYHQVDWHAPLALVIGSEAHGPPPDLLGFSWGQVTIPHDTRVESLNAAVAGSIILFEIARQRGAG